MTTITRDIAKAIRVDLDKALKAVGEKYGIELTAGSASFNDTTYTVKVNGKVEGSDSADMIKLRAYAPLYGFKPELCNAVVNIEGTEFRVVGLKRSKVVIERTTDNKSYVYSLDQLKNLVSSKYPELLK